MPSADPGITSALVEQYKLYVESAENVSSRRADVNKYYLSVLTALLVVIPFAIDSATPPDLRLLVFVLLGTLGLAICILWMINIRSYSQLNKLKYVVVHEMEKDLPFACFSREWELLDDPNYKLTFIRLGKVERFMPLILAVPFLVMSLYSIITR